MYKFISFICLVLNLLLTLQLDTLGQNINTIGYNEEGKASFYPDNRNGALTSSGEKYNMYELEGAHKHIAFNTLVKVTNLDNQKTAYVRINDRPYTNSRIMDFTLAAAKKLKMVNNSIANIKIEIVANNVFRKPIAQYQVVTKERNISKPVHKNSLINNTKPVSLDLSKEKLTAIFKPVETYTANGQTVYPKGFGIQMGSFTDIKVTFEKVKELEELQLKNVFIQAGWNKSKKIYRVIFGNFQDKEQAVFMENLLKNGFEGIFIKQHLLYK